jgi:alpha-methylacyl-CoA racemase
VPPLNLLADFGGGAMFLTTGVLAALIHARATGEGQVVDAAMSDGAACLMTLIYQLRAGGKWNDERATNVLDGGAPYYDCYRCSDGAWISIAAIEPAFFARLAVLLEMPDEIARSRDDPRGWAALRAYFEDVFAKRSQADWCALLEDTDVCFSPVLPLGDAARHRHNLARGAFRMVAGEPCPNPAPRFSGTPSRVAHEAGCAPAQTWNWLDEAMAAHPAMRGEGGEPFLPV